MLKPYTMLNVELTPQNALQFIHAVDAGGLPWQFMGETYSANQLVLYVDDSSAALTITLNPDGTWAATSAVEVPVQ